MPDLTKILAENQNEMLKLIAPLNEKLPVCLNVQDSECDPENISVARTSTHVKTYTATSSKTTSNTVVTYRSSETVLFNFIQPYIMIQRVESFLYINETNLSNTFSINFSSNILRFSTNYIDTKPFCSKSVLC